LLDQAGDYAAFIFQPLPLRHPFLSSSTLCPATQSVSVGDVRLAEICATSPGQVVTLQHSALSFSSSCRNAEGGPQDFGAVIRPYGLVTHSPMSGRQLDFSRTWASGAEQGLSRRMGHALVPAEIDDEKLIAAIPEVESCRQPQSRCGGGAAGDSPGAVPALATLCRRFAGFGTAE
jgi:hypothetical protein